MNTEDFKKCIECKEFSGYIKDLCSVCHESKFPSKPIRLPEVTEDTFMKVLQIYQEEKNSDYKIPNNKQFKILRKIIVGKNPTEISLILHGFKDFPKTILRANQADILLQQCMDSQEDIKDEFSYVDHEGIRKTIVNIRKGNYNYIHVICPQVVDPWNFQFQDNLLLCYYKDFGELKECPKSIKKLKEYWQFNFINFPYNIEYISDCIVCLEKIKSGQRFGRCKVCNYCIHGKCGDKCDNNCPNCRTEHDSKNKKETLEIIGNRDCNLQSLNGYFAKLTGMSYICETHDSLYCRYPSKKSLQNFLFEK